MLKKYGNGARDISDHYLIFLMGLQRKLLHIT